MIIRCPKCGFEQPKDQYCANCGVNMSTFKTKVQPSWKRIIFSTGFQMVFLLLMIISGANLIYQAHIKELKERISYLKGNTFIASQFNSELEEKNEAVDENSISDEEQETPENSTEIQNKSANTKNDLGKAEKLDTEDQKKDESQSKINNKKISAVFHFAEINTATAEILANQSQRFPGFSEGPSGWYGQLNGFDQFSKKIKIVFSNQVDLEVGSEGTQEFEGIQDPEKQTEIGISMFIAVSELSDKLIKGEVELLYSNNDQKISSPASFELIKGNIFAISGVVPQNMLPHEKKEEGSRSPFLSMLRSPEILSNKTQVMIFVELK